jgi:thioredoxin 1
VFKVLLVGMALGAVVGGAIGFLVRRLKAGEEGARPGWSVRGALIGALLGGVAAQSLPILLGSGYSPDVSPVTSQQQFASNVLEAEVPVLVDFYKHGCPPCARLAPVLEALASEYQGKARIVKVDVAHHPRLAATYGVKYTPTVVLFTGGEPARWIVGAKPEEEYRTALDEALSGEVAPPQQES